VEWAHEELPPANQAKKMFDPTATIQPLGTPTEPAPDPLEHARYWYDGDGMMVKGQVNGTVTYYPGRHYNKEVKESAVTTKKFYAAAGQTVAVRSVQEAQDVLKWMLTDHLGSASVTANENGTWNSTIQYTAFGEVRAKNGVTPGDYRYTGQLEQAELGLYYYVARWYDPAIAHFAQADTIVPSPGNAVAYDRYAYVINNPILLNDPSGHESVPWWAPILSTLSDSLCSIADPERNPRTAEFHNAFWDGVDAWVNVVSMSYTLVTYTETAIKESRTKDAVRGIVSIGRGALTISTVPTVVVTNIVIGVVTTPIRIFSKDIPEFVGAVDERRNGKDRFWDVLFTGANLSGDIVSLYGIGKGAARVQNFAKDGREIRLGDNFRIAPFGNKTTSSTGRLPHYHRRVVDINGITKEGQGIGRHRPWDVKKVDKSFWDRW